MGDTRSPKGWAKKRERDRDYGNANREARLARGKAWKEANPERMKAHLRKHHLKRTFGITPDEYDRMLEDQGGRCAICAGTDTSPWDWFTVDHDHETGEVRGLLCHACNICIGRAKDDPAILRHAAHYLEFGW